MAKKKKKTSRILVCGHGRHGKDLTAEVIQELYGYQFRGSSEVMCQELFENFSDRYESAEELFNNRHKHRDELYRLICEFNTPDKTKLARIVMGDDAEFGYTGMRDFEEVMACIREGLFTHIIWVERRNAPVDATQKFSFEDLYEEFLREDTSFSLAKVKNYPVWSDGFTDEALMKEVKRKLRLLMTKRNMKNFLESNGMFTMFA